ncbi:MAG: PQQ-binding-like beta-propeller repeat protein [Steroidobacteraceae bacterium]
MRQRARVLAVLGLILSAPIIAAPASTAKFLSLPGTESGFAIFQTQCTRCHGNPRAAARAPSPATLRQMPPERIYAALTTGSMRIEARQLSDAQKRRVAEFMSGRPLGSAAQGSVKTMQGRCRSNPPLRWRASFPQWNGWGADPHERRFQSADAAGLGPGNVATLTLRWAFGFPAGVSAFAQPSIVFGRVFVGSDIGFLYSLDARTGCSHWSFEAKGSIRTATSIGRVTAKGRRVYAVFFGDSKANVYALDAHTGRLLWRRKMDGNFTARITGAPTLSGNVLYVPVSSAEEFTASAPSYACCTFRGSVVALDTSTGRRLWKTYVIPERPRPTRRDREGTQLWAPAGGSVWDAPTVDALRHTIYFGTGDAETSPASPHSDAVMALDARSGKLLWVHQELANDAWIGGCDGSEPPLACPKPLGPDRDIGNSPILVSLPAGRRLLVNGTKDARVVALDPDRNGAVVWQVRVEPDLCGAALPWGVLFGGAADEQKVYYPLACGRMVALSLASGRLAWSVQLAPPSAGQSYGAAPTVIPGVVFVGGYDGRLLALSTENGRVLWQFATARPFKTVNGVAAKGGSFGSAGPTVAAGMLFVGSGYGVTTGKVGNVLLAFAAARPRQSKSAGPARQR